MRTVNFCPALPPLPPFEMIMSVGAMVGRPAQPAQPSSQVWYDDIPGSICGPEDGP